MTVMTERLLLNSKYIKMGHEEGGFQAFLTQPHLNGYPFSVLRPVRRA